MNNEIRHFGVKGMKWGVRRYHNADGTLTAAGKKRYGSKDMTKLKRTVRKASKDLDKFFEDRQKRPSYYNPETGRTIYVTNKKLEDKAMKSSVKVDKLVSELTKKYGVARAIPNTYYNDGSRYIDLVVGSIEERIRI